MGKVFLDWELSPSDLDDDLTGEKLEEHIAKLMEAQMDSKEMQQSYGLDAESISEAALSPSARYRKLTRGAWDRLATKMHITSKSKGFWDEPVIMDKYVAKLCLIHSEVTEVMEALRKSQGTAKVTEEIADVVIRTLDLYAALVEAGEADPELWGVLEDKMQANAARPAKHGNRWG